MTDESTGWATENVVEPTPEEIDALAPLTVGLGGGFVSCGCWRCMGRSPDNTLHGIVAETTNHADAGITSVYTPDGDAVTETSAGDPAE